MKITDFAIKNRPSVAILTAMLTIGGLISYLTIPKESFPSIEIPSIVVTTLYPGASPGDIESLLTKPIEQEVQTVNGIKEIRSTSSEGVSTVVVEFTPDVSMDDAFQKVRERVDVAKPELPGDVEEPIVAEIDFAEIPIMSINLAGPYALTRLKDVAEDLADRIETLPTILEVDVIGGLDREIKVSVDLHALQGYGLSFDEIINTIRDENVNIPGGSMDVDRLSYLVRIDGEFDHPEDEIGSLVVKAPNGRPIYISDVATIDFGFKERTTYSRLQLMQVEEGRRLVRLPEDRAQANQVVTLNVKKRSGANILDTAASVNQILASADLPPSVQVEITGDQSELVQQFVTDLENNIISGLIFVVLVLLFFLGVRTATLVGIAIPLSMFLSFIVFQIIGQELNFVILFSLIIALGMLVDNAVVIVENIFRYREMGYSRWDAARQGTKEVSSAVVASTATTVAVFIPMMFWPGITGEFMGFLPKTLIVTLICSLVVAIIINPVITGFFVRLDTEPRAKRARFVQLLLITLIISGIVMLALANWRTALVAVTGIPLLVLMHRYVFSRVAVGFVRTGLPQLITHYRAFLRIMLDRDYTSQESPFARTLLWRLALLAGIAGVAVMVVAQSPIASGTPLQQMLMPVGFLPLMVCAVMLLIAVLRTRNAHLRNMFALAALALAVVLGVAGGAAAGFLNQTAAMVLLVPAGLMLLVGLIMVLIHACELLYLGGWTSTKAGGILAGVSIAILSIMALARGVEFSTILILLLLPMGIMAVGALGALVNGRLHQRRSALLLTDNRSKLLVGTVAGFLAIMGLFAAAPTGVEFFPDTDPNLITLSLELPLGTHVHETNRVSNIAQDRIIELLQNNATDRANVKNMLVNVGGGSGGPLEASFGGSTGNEGAVITLNMVDYEDRPAPSRSTLQRLRQRLQGIPGVRTEINRDSPGPPVGKPVNIEISGEDFATISRITQEVKDLLQAAADDGTIAGLVDLNDNLNTGRPEMHVRIDRERAARFKLNTRRVAQEVRAAINGVEATKYRTGDDEFDIIVRLNEQQRSDLEAIKYLTIEQDGILIPITAVADFEIEGGLGSITRLDLLRVATITGDVSPGFNGNAVLVQVQNYLNDYTDDMPPGYNLAYTGENEEQAEAFGFLGTAMMIGVAAIFLILIAQFNSVIAPFIIMVAVLLSLIGVLLGLILTRTSFGLMTFIGVISLAGIVVNNNIVLIDYIRQLRDRGLSKLDAIVEGGATRLRPVVLTVLTTIIGLVPLTFGINVDFVGLITNLQPNFEIGSENTQFWGAMGTAIISGLTFATFLTLVIVPVMYSAFDSLSLLMRQIFRSEQPATADEVPA
ncbi:MAG: efflux RND transporter permease subunit [Bacteroidota bacterium]|nr:efflux RND transporter permease subunit [Bacteroidota bacterium]